MNRFFDLGGVRKSVIDASAEVIAMYPNMLHVLPPGKKGNVEIRHSNTSTERAYIESIIRNELRVPGPHLQFDIAGVGWMFDTLHEKWMNKTAVDNAAGNVLIGGLGIGMILWPILRKPEVTSVLVIENNQNVVDLVLPSLDEAKGREKLTVQLVDALDFHTNEKFDYIWLDCIPFYGYHSQVLDIQEKWIKHFRRFATDPFMVDHWGWQENLLYHLYGADDDEWPEEHKRTYPCTPPDPEILALISTHPCFDKLLGNQKERASVDDARAVVNELLRFDSRRAAS